jgi:hypothetical protein
MSYESVVNAAHSFDRKGYCRLSFLQDGILCMSTTEGPGILVTACVHGNEHYGTIDTVFKLVKKNSIKGHFLPVVDIEGYSQTAGLNEGHRIYHSLREKRSTRLPTIDNMSDRITGVIDLHNWVMGSYMFIHTRTIKDSVLKEISKAASPHVYTGGPPGYFYHGSDGFFLYTGMERGMIGWAENNGKKAVAAEVPALHDCRKLIDLDYIVSKNCRIVKAFSRSI